MPNRVGNEKFQPSASASRIPQTMSSFVGAIEIVYGALVIIGLLCFLPVSQKPVAAGHSRGEIPNCVFRRSFSRECAALTSSVVNVRSALR